MRIIICKDCGCEVEVRGNRQLYCKLCAKERLKLSQKKYDQSEKHRQTQKKYRQSEKYRLSRKKYLQSEKGKQTQKKYRQSEKYRLSQKEYLQSEKCKSLFKSKNYKDKKHTYNVSEKFKNSNCYIINSILRIKDAPPELIELKRTQLMIKREFKAAK